MLSCWNYLGNFYNNRKICVHFGFNNRQRLWRLLINCLLIWYKVLKQTGSHTRLTILISSNQKTQETTAVQTGSRIKLCSATSCFRHILVPRRHQLPHHQHHHNFHIFKSHILILNIICVWFTVFIVHGADLLCALYLKPKFPDRTIQVQNALNNQHNYSNTN